MSTVDEAMSTKGTKRAVTTETKIKRALTRLHKLVQQYYDENPDTTNNDKGNTDIINYYGSATIGTTYNEHTDKWLTIANITLRGTDGHFDIRSPIDHKPVKQEYR